MFLHIEVQLSNTTVKDESKDEESSLQDDMHHLQLLLQRLLLYPTSNSVEEEWKRCDDAVDAVVQYCDVLECGPLCDWPKQIKTTSIPSTDPEPDLDGSSKVRDCLDKNMETTLCPHDELFCTTQKHLTDVLKPRVCFQCFANGKLRDQTCCRMFYDTGCMTEHFDARHLHEDSLKCNYCEVFLLHKMEFGMHLTFIE